MVMKRNTRFVVSVFLIIFLLTLISGTFRTYLVLGTSDIPTLFNGDKVIINRSAYDLTIPFTDLRLIRLKDPERGDLVLCSIPEIIQNEYCIKRIIGLPGDTIEIISNKLVINGKKMRYADIHLDLPDSALNNIHNYQFAIESGLGLENGIVYNTIINALSNFGPVVIEQGHYFLLGDNRINSMDSRLLGHIPRSAVLGKYYFRIYEAMDPYLAKF